MAVSKALVQLPTKPHALYRFFDRTDVLLYVGITMDLPARVGQHQKDKPWWVEVHHIAIEQLETRSAALAAEEKAIREEGPLYNAAHNQLVSGGSADLIRTAVGSKRAYADHLLHLHSDGPEQYEGWLEKARRDIGDAESEDGLTGADEVVYAVEVAAIERYETMSSIQRALGHLMDQFPHDQVDRCRDRAQDEAASFDTTLTELELVSRMAWFIGAEFAAQYLGELPEDERAEWIKAARAFMNRPKARWWEVAMHAAAYARHRKADKWYAPAAAMCSTRGRFSIACPSNAEVRVWFEDCRMCRSWEECQSILAELKGITDRAVNDDGGQRELTDDEMRRYEYLEAKCGALRAQDCDGHTMWCRGHFRQAIGKPFTWRVDDLPMVVSRHEELPPDWDDPWRSGDVPF